MPPSLTFAIIKERFEEKGAKLIINEEEYNDLIENNIIKSYEKIKFKFNVICKCGHPSSINLNNLKSVSNFICLNCLELSTKLPYFIINDRFKEKGAKLIITEEEYNEKIRDKIIKQPSNYKFEVICKCGDKRLIDLNYLKQIDNLLCLSCSNINDKLSYNVIKEKFKDKKGELLMGENEYNELIINRHIIMPSRHDFNLIAACGHPKVASINTIHNCDIIICSECTEKSRIEKIIEIHKRDENGNNYANKLEYDGFVYIKNIFNEKFDIIKLSEGTKADFLLKPKNINENLYIQIQLKTTYTTNKNNQYRFNLDNNNYNTMIIIFVCVKDEKIWIAPGKNIINLAGIGFTNNERSKYYKYKCDVNKLCENMINYYHNDDIIKINNNLAYENVCSNVAKEQKYRKIRENKINFLEFENNKIENMVYDFKINNYKIQEKLSQYDEKNLRFHVYLSKYKKDSVNLKQPYSKGDNDFYWIHIPDEKLFYVIPEFELINIKFIKTDEIKGKMTMTLYPNKSIEELKSKKILTTFANEHYLFNYENLDKERLLNMFNNL